MPVVVALLVSVIGSGIYVVGSMGLRLNLSDSMPEGVWQVVERIKPLERGEVVVLCPPHSFEMQLALKRGYIPAGSCAGGFEPLVKPVAAVVGDLVVVKPEGISVNGLDIPNTAQLWADSDGRRLPRFPAGSYRVEPGQVWLLTNQNPRSYDSRYWGPVQDAGVSYTTRPIWVVS